MIKKTLAILLCLGVALTACGSSPEHEAEVAKHKPALPSIKVYMDSGEYSYTILRHCDGTTLLYVRDDSHAGMSVIPNSPVCGAK